MNSMDFYLAGGTALALQIGHRTSQDFDFYSGQKFDNKVVADLIRKNFSNPVIDLNQSEDTFQAKIDDVSLSIFYYNYPLLDELVKYPPVKLAGLRDLAAMKVVSLVQRARQRDFADVYYLMKKMGPSEIVKATFEKFPWYQDNPEVIFRSLVYFEEADNDAEAQRVVLLDKSVTWTTIRTELSKLASQAALDR